MTSQDAVTAAREAERGGAWDDALARFEEAFAMLIAQDAGAEDFANLMRWIGTVHRQRGELERADEAYDASLAIAEQADLPLATASVLNCIGIVAQYRGDVRGASNAYTRARALAGAAGNDQVAAMVEVNHATLASIRGEYPVAISIYRSAVDRFRALGNVGAVCSTLNNLGMAYRDRRDWVEAERCLDEAYQLGDQLNDAALLGNIDLNRAELRLRSDDFSAAREYCDRAFETFTHVESHAGLGEAYKLYGALFARMGRPGLAETHLDRALELAILSEDRLLEAEVNAVRGQTHLDAQRIADALQCLNTAYRMFRDLGAQAALLDVDRRLDNLEETYLKVVAAWAESIDAKDSYTAGHCARVADLACRLAERCGYTGRELTWFRMGGFLHDVGKTAVPLEVLNKPGKLTEDEWEIMKNHTVAGSDIVEQLNFPWEIVPMVRSHHERWNGTGYPDRLAGDAIARTARILGVADVYDALTTARSYRAALPHDEAMRIMAADAGVGLDPTLFAEFRDMLDGAGTSSARPHLRILSAA